MKSQIFRSVIIIGIFAQSWSRVQHRLNRRIRWISSEGRGYPSVLRKVWPVYCSIQSWRFGCSWRKNSTRDTLQLPLVWLYQGKSFQDFPFKNFQSDFRLLWVWDKSLSDQDAGKYRLEQLLRVTYSTTQERKMIRLS